MMREDRRSHKQREVGIPLTFGLSLFFIIIFLPNVVYILSLTCLGNSPPFVPNATQIFQSQLMPHPSGSIVAPTGGVTAVCGKKFVAGGGDRRPDRHIQYPPGAMIEQGGPTIDITKPPYNAKGDGMTDDTQAFVKAYDFSLAEFNKGGWNDSGPNDRYNSYIIYLPHGTYLVSDTIIYSDVVRSQERIAMIHFMGESRDHSIIKLRDNAPGFGDANNQKPVLSVAKTDFNNRVSGNQISTLTVDTGKGNPGAVGINFTGANASELRDLTVCSEDGQGAGGIHIWAAPAFGYYRDITVQGFDYGIWLDASARASSVSFEYVTLQNQRKAGIGVTLSTSASFRKLTSQNSVPALDVGNRGGQVSIIDSILSGGSANQPAMVVGEGQLFARNIITQGYGLGLSKGGAIAAPAGTISEYVSGPVFKHPQATRMTSLNLPIEEVPEVPWPTTPSGWARPEDFGDSAQQAMDSGASTIYFPKKGFNFGDVSVPASVQRITCMHRGGNGIVHVTGGSSTPLVVEDGCDQMTVISEGARVVEINATRWMTYRRSSTIVSPLTVFINNNAAPTSSFGSQTGVKFYLRADDNEGAHLPIVCDGGLMWIFGVKTEREGGGGSFLAKDNCQMEIVGGSVGVRSPGPNLRVENSQVTATFSTSGFGNASGDIIVSDSGYDVNARMLPVRKTDTHSGTGPDNVFLPLYISR